MKTISLKARTMPQIVKSGEIRKVMFFLEKNSLSIVIVSTMVAFLGCIFGSDMILFSGAAAAMFGLYPETIEKKGGKK